MILIFHPANGGGRPRHGNIQPTTPFSTNHFFATSDLIEINNWYSHVQKWDYRNAHGPTPPMPGAARA
jgi:hypothetical protein